MDHLSACRYFGESMMLGLVLAGAPATSGWAQCACNGSNAAAVVTNVPTSQMAVAGPVQTYQRFSYAPSEMAVATSPAPMMQYSAAPVSRPMAVQNYRRFSYQPSVQSKTSHDKPAYLYSKADPRRQQH